MEELSDYLQTLSLETTPKKALQRKLEEVKKKL